jgi:hypothetical protein
MNGLIDEPKSTAPDYIAREFDVIGLLQDELKKSGDLYLKVALWKVLMRVVQHVEDLVDPSSPASLEILNRLLVRLLSYSEMLLRESSNEGGLDQQKHGTNEAVVMANIKWLREKVAIWEMDITEDRRNDILGTIFGVKS